VETPAANVDVQKIKTLAIMSYEYDRQPDPGEGLRLHLNENTARLLAAAPGTDRPPIAAKLAARVCDSWKRQQPTLTVKRLMRLPS
jgi:hypothetical protein